MKQNSFVMDTENFAIAIKTPIIISVVLGLASLFSISLGYFSFPVLTLLMAFTGATYMKLLMDTGKKPLLINAGLNAAILSGTTMLVYVTISFIASSIAYRNWDFNFLSLIFSGFDGGITGFLGALAWYAYNTQTNN
jgi:hypothetical protein